MHLSASKRLLRADNDLIGLGINRHNIKRAFSLISTRAPANTKASALADRVINHPVVTAKHRAINMYDVTRINRARPQPAHNIAITPIWHKADILTIGLFRDGKTKFPRQIAGFILIKPTKRKPQVIQLFSRRGKQKVGLILGRISTAQKAWTVTAIHPLHIMASGKAISLEITRRFQQIGKFHRLVTAHTRDRRFTAKIAIGEILHDLIMEAAFIIKHIMRNAKARRNCTRIMDINPCAARAFCLNRDAMIIKLQRNANHIKALFMQQSSRYG